MPELTPEQIAAQQKAQEAAAARAKVRAETKARRDGYRAMIGTVLNNGDETATITGFDKDHDCDGVRGETFTVHFGNPNNQSFKNCEKFLSEFTQKGAV